MKLAGSKCFSNLSFLCHVLEEEYRRKQIRAKALRLHNARIPELLVMETFPFQRQPNLDSKRILDIYDSFDYISKTRHGLWLGPTGCGKTGLCTVFLLQAIDRSGNGSPGGCAPDRHGEGVPDGGDSNGHTDGGTPGRPGSADINANGVPEECEPD